MTPGETTLDALAALAPDAQACAADEMQNRIEAFDWSTTPLGAFERWPQSLRTAVRILLSSRYAMWMAWGPEMTMLYNDAYSPTLGIKHPKALGRPANEVWAEIWDDIGPRTRTVLSGGKATYDEGLMLLLERSGFPEETYHTFSYSPLADDAGNVSGMLCVVTEETDRFIGERRIETLRKAASALASTITESEVLKVLATVLEQNKKDLPFTLVYLFERDGSARRGSMSGMPSQHPLAPEIIAADSNSPWPSRQILLHSLGRLLENLSGRRVSFPVPSGDWNKAPDQAVVVAIRQQGQEKPAGFFVAGINPYRRFDAAYEGFVDLLSGQIAAGLANARAYAVERQRAEALAELDRAKTAFFSNVSHELRTPLTLMLSPVEELLAKSKSDRTPEDYQMLNLVQRNGLRLQKLVNTLLDFSRIEAGRMAAVFEPLDLAFYTAELAGNFSSAMERAGLEFSIMCSPLADPVYVDREMWEKIVLNLLSNALKFTFEGSIRLSLQLVGDRVVLKVSDTGTGIEASELPHLFERFHRVERARARTIEGTGIGLALVQELVKLHGGSVTVESEVGKGTTFHVSLPVGSAHLPKDKVRETAETLERSHRSDTFVGEALRWLADDSEKIARVADVSSERILIADDNADMREYVSRLLGERYQVAVASDGQEALASALTHPPDLILSDVMMPRLDGFGLLAELRKRAETGTIPVILLSARAGEESRVDGLGAGADDYLVKPFTARELLARVGAHLAMRRRREEAERSVRESRATLQSFYDSSPFLMGIAETDEKSVFSVYGNRATARFFGVEAEDIAALEGKPFAIMPEVERLWHQQYARSEAEGVAVRFEYEHPTPEGGRWLSATASYLGAGPSGRSRFSFVAEDTTEKRQAQELLQHSNEELRRANSDLEQFAYSASHDLQEPLRQVAVYSQLLARKYSENLDPKAHAYLGYCVEGAQRMEMLIADLLAYSQTGRTGGNAIQNVDLNEVMEGVRKNLAATLLDSNAVLTVEDLPAVSGNAVPLTHLFQNLISNAVKYRSARRPELSICAVDDGAFWRLAVTDNGIGIPAEFHSQVFGLFKRLHDRNVYPGTGIGLAICQKIVEGSGGRIWVESEVDRGSTFFFTLPKEKL